MSASSSDRFRQADAVFDAALDLPDAERATFIDRHTADDADLRDRVHRLLRAHRESEAFLETPAVALAAGLIEGDIPLSGPARVGPFRIVREIGQGGMGAVYLAERDDGHFAQRVAVKLPPAGFMTGDLVRRFLDERRILATLEHASIARLVDGGIEDGRFPWFAMEYVEGEPIDRYCAERQLGIDERIRLFIDVCAAVQYAHQRLVVHGDLKPSNLLVTADGRPKLLDFGISRLLDPASDAEATRTLLQRMTPACASPEQVRGEPIGTASDVWSLGVLLYELLAGRRPHDVSGRSPAEVETIICEHEPARPSAVATPGRNQRRLRGDLDTIVMMALRKEPSRRYASAAAFAEDLQRFLDGLPVQASPDSAAYRARKFIARNLAAVSAAAVFVALLMAGAVRERVLRGEAEHEAATADAVQDFLVGVFDVADPFAPPDESGEEVTARTLLDRGAARVDLELGDQPEVQAELKGALGRVYTNLGLYDAAGPLLEASLEQSRRLRGGRSAAAAQAMQRLGALNLARGDLDAAEQLLREALALNRSLGDEAATARSLDLLATVHQERSDYDAAEPLFRESVEILERVRGPHHADVAMALTNLGLLQFVKGRYDEAEPLYRRALAIDIAHFGEDHPTTAQLLHNLAQVQQLREQIDEAETLFRRALAAKRKSLGDAHPSVTINLNNLGRLVMSRPGGLEEAETLIREALALDRRMFGENHRYVAASLDNLATVLRYGGRFDEAEPVVRQALAVNRATLGEENTAVALNLNSLGAVLEQQGRLEDSEAFFRQSLALYEKLLGEEHLYVSIVRFNLAHALQAAAKNEEAGALFEDVVARLGPIQPQGRVQYLGARIGLGMTQTAKGLAAEALPGLQAMVDTTVAELGESSLRAVEARVGLGMALLALGRAPEAVPPLDAATLALEPSRTTQPRLWALAQATRRAAGLAAEPTSSNPAGRFRPDPD